MMRTQSQDTDANVEAVLVNRLRQLPLAKKFAQIRSLTEITMRLSRRAIQRSHQGMNEKDLNRLFVELYYGKELASRLQDYIENKAQ